MRTVSYELNAEWLTIQHPESGQVRHLRQGDTLPRWLSATELKKLHESGVISEYAVI